MTPTPDPGRAPALPGPGPGSASPDCKPRSAVNPWLNPSPRCLPSHISSTSAPPHLCIHYHCPLHKADSVTPALTQPARAPGPLGIPLCSPTSHPSKLQPRLTPTPRPQRHSLPQAADKVLMAEARGQENDTALGREKEACQRRGRPQVAAMLSARTRSSLRAQSGGPSCKAPQCSVEVEGSEIKL